MRPIVPVLSALAALSSTNLVFAQSVTRAILKQGDALSPGRTVSDVQGGTTNTVGGFAFLVTSTDGANSLVHIWGSPTATTGSILRTSGSTIGAYTLESGLNWESIFGLGNSGQLCYSPPVTSGTSTNLDSVWLDNTPLSIKGEFCPASLVFPAFVPANERWAFASSPLIAAQTGEGWFVAGLTTSTTSTTSQRRALIRQLPPAAASVVLVAGQSLSGVAEPISDTSSMLFAWGLSPNGQHYIMPVTLNAAAASDKLLTLDGVPITLGTAGDTALFREGVVIPGSAGGIGDSWAQPSGAATIAASCAVNNSGRWAVSARTNSGIGNVLVRDGRIWVREGDTVDGFFITGTISDVRLNSAGDIAWFGTAGDMFTNARAVMLNRRVIARVGQNVDIDGDGVPDATATIADIGQGGFITQAGLGISERTGSALSVYFSGKINTETLTNAPAAFVVRVCLADFNGGGLSVQDIFDFLNAWFASDLRADFNANGALEVQDIFDFLNAWFAGC